MKWLGPAAIAAFELAQGAAVARQDFSQVEIKTTDRGHGMYMLEGGARRPSSRMSSVPRTISM